MRRLSWPDSKLSVSIHRGIQREAAATDFLAELGDTAGEKYIKTVSAVQKLLNPHEMGELFKCIAFGKNINPDWLGFNGLDLSGKL